MTLKEYYIENVNDNDIEFLDIKDKHTEVELSFKVAGDKIQNLTFSDLILAKYLMINVKEIVNRSDLLALIKDKFLTHTPNNLPFGDNSWELDLPIPNEWRKISEAQAKKMQDTKQLTSFTIDIAKTSSSRVLYQYLLIRDVVILLERQKSVVNDILQKVLANPKLLLKTDVLDSEYLMEMEEVDE